MLLPPSSFTSTRGSTQLSHDFSSKHRHYNTFISFILFISITTPFIISQSCPKVLGSNLCPTKNSQILKVSNELQSLNMFIASLSVYRVYRVLVVVGPRVGQWWVVTTSSLRLKSVLHHIPSPPCSLIPSWKFQFSCHSAIHFRIYMIPGCLVLAWFNIKYIPAV